MKFNSNKKRITIIAIIVFAAVLLVAGIVAGIILIPRAITPDVKPEVTGIRISAYPKLKYYVGEEFDCSTLRIQVLATTDDLSYFVDSSDSELKCSGFDSSVPNDSLTITVTYKEYTTTYQVRIVEQPIVNDTPALKSIRLSKNFKTEYSASDWNTYGPDLRGVTIVLEFSDGSLDEVPAILDYCLDYNRNLTANSTYDLVITYIYDSQTYTCSVPITITE